MPRWECTSGLRGVEVNKRYDYKDQEFNLKMRVKFLEKKLREPDHDVDKYQEWESNLEMVTDELTKLQVKKFKYFLGKWVHNFKEQNQLINVIDCMFVALEKTDQKDVAMKWYMRVTDPKETRCLEKLLEYKTAEVNMWKANIKTIKKQKNEAKQLMKKQCKESIKQSKEMMSRNYDTLLRQHVLELNHYKNKHDENQNILEAMKERIHTLEREKYDLKEKLKKVDAMQEEIDKRAEVYKEGLIKSGLKNILQKEDS